ncbi:hypothetical protein CISG_00397 [Coccidioides immitis RMSCC 3703]|uniref:Uncharacterized protein n=1 Tax=Coccidioides immitis RMSCC 3703 TaxID=454286 RepID=A0A0J8QLL7_COCIT|nr:hypothetical protein CISG_00397 [Coccidioides immitis RMSCC 3703]
MNGPCDNGICLIHTSILRTASSQRPPGTTSSAALPRRPHRDSIAILPGAAFFSSLATHKPPRPAQAHNPANHTASAPASVAACFMFLQLISPTSARESPPIPLIGN